MPFIPQVHYRDSRAALHWLEEAFGFSTTLAIENAEGNLEHAEMSFGPDHFQLGAEWADPDQLGTAEMKSPRAIGGINTRGVELVFDADIDSHCAQARAHGAAITQEPTDQFYGARAYRAVDLEGHVWTFPRFYRELSNEEMAAASGLKIRDSL